METLEQLRKQLTSDLKTSFLKRASDTDSSRKPEAVIGEVSLMLATNIADYSEKLLREIVIPGYVTDEYDKRYTLLSIFNEHEANLREAKHINAEQLASINRVISWFAFDEEHNAVYVKNNYNFYAEGAVSARGFATGGGGGGGGMDEDLLWSILGDGDNPDKQIASTHLTKALAGYATKDWVTDKHYATEQWVTGKGYATITWVTETFVRKDDYDSLWDAKMANWFKKDTDGNIYTTVNFYSEQGVSAKGANTSGGGGGEWTKNFFGLFSEMVTIPVNK